jgi:hypothetical protein
MSDINKVIAAGVEAQKYKWQACDDPIHHYFDMTDEIFIPSLGLICNLSSGGICSVFESQKSRIGMSSLTYA